MHCHWPLTACVLLLAPHASSALCVATRPYSPALHSSRTRRAPAPQSSQLAATAGLTAVASSFIALASPLPDRIVQCFTGHDELPVPATSAIVLEPIPMPASVAVGDAEAANSILAPLGNPLFLALSAVSWKLMFIVTAGDVVGREIVERILASDGKSDEALPSEAEAAEPRSEPPSEPLSSKLMSRSASLFAELLRWKWRRPLIAIPTVLIGIALLFPASTVSSWASSLVMLPLELIGLGALKVVIAITSILQNWYWL